MESKERGRPPFCKAAAAALVSLCSAFCCMEGQTTLCSFLPRQGGGTISTELCGKTIAPTLHSEHKMIIPTHPFSASCM